METPNYRGACLRRFFVPKKYLASIGMFWYAIVLLSFFALSEVDG